MDSEQILKLIEAVSASRLTEFKYEEGETKLVLKCEQAPIYMMPQSSGENRSVSMPGTPAVSGPAAGEEAGEAAGLDAETTVSSPLVGTFYSAASEDAEPFVSVGDTVKKGQVLGIIETMKLMNEIECERDGVISAVLIENEQIVEYGQPLFRIR